MSGVVKGQWQAANGVEAQTLPKSYGPRVGADNKVELHRPKTAAARIFERVLAHLAPNATPCRVACCYVAAVCHMRAAAELICAQVIGPEQTAVLLGNECLAVRAHPIRDRVRPAHVARQRVGLAGADHRLKDAPYGLVVFRLGGSDQHRLPLSIARLDDATIGSHDRLVQPVGRSRDLRVAEAVQGYLAIDAWQFEKTECALQRPSEAILPPSMKFLACEQNLARSKKPTLSLSPRLRLDI
jgi:hypothetical protein